MQFISKQFNIVDFSLPSSISRFSVSLSLSIFREFIIAWDGNAVNIMDTNFTELERLCDEFCFTELATALAEFRPPMDFKEASEDADARRRTAGLE
jgi:hypothetical protein